jgi:RNA polymerase sigma factor (TIGR02999 family)
MAGADSERPITALLLDWRNGNADAGRELIGRLEPELRKIARQYMRRERGDHTLQPTALVSELFLRLIGGQPIAWTDRAHFLAVTSQHMRRILVDHARMSLAAKRGGGAANMPLEQNDAAVHPVEEELLDLHGALEELGELDSRAARVIELRYFGGMSEEEAAEALGISVSTAKRDWNVGRAWLVSRLKS